MVFISGRWFIYRIFIKDHTSELIKKPSNNETVPGGRHPVSWLKRVRKQNCLSETLREIVFLDKCGDQKSSFKFQNYFILSFTLKVFSKLRMWLCDDLTMDSDKFIYGLFKNSVTNCFHATCVLNNSIFFSLSESRSPTYNSVHTVCFLQLSQCRSKSDSLRNHKI